MDDSTNDARQQVIDSLKQASNILVTVKNSPTIDQLAACIGLTLILNDQGKHGTAVFSGEVPSVLEFLEPGKTLERNADSLQDFIISLDKSKADKLRYKVEDSTVRIFITPYKTSITEKDLEFGQGDFNVDVVVALGVHNQDDLDQAITSHGRILHDATVISMNTEPGGDNDLGSINWIDTECSSLSEMVAGMANALGKDSNDSKGKKHKDDDNDDDDRKDVIDNQIATALLTGIVAETERFGNAKTTPATMETAAKLLTAGANQELVATKLAETEKHKHADHDDHDDIDNIDNIDNDEPRDNSHDDGKGLDSDKHYEDGETARADEHDNDEHSDAPKSIYEESSDEGIALMPSLSQSGGDENNFDKADNRQGNAEETIDHSNDDSQEPIAAGDGSIDIEHPDSPDDQGSTFKGQELQLGDHHDGLAASSTEVTGFPSLESNPSDIKEEDDLALAHAGTSFDMPQPASDNGGDVPLLSPLMPQTGAASEPASVSRLTDTKNEDQAEMDILKRSHPQTPPKIQPLHATHGVYIAPPTHDAPLPDQSGSSGDAEAPSGGSPYGLTPPTMGGTLTSNITTDRVADPMSSGASGSVNNQPPTLTHSSPDFSKLQTTLAPPIAAVAPATTSTVNPAYVLEPSPASAAPTDPLIAPLAPATQTLAELEQKTNSSHISASDAAMNMPAPTLTPMLTLTPPTQSSASSLATPTAPMSLPPTPPPISSSLIAPLYPTPPAAI